MFFTEWCPLLLVAVGSIIMAYNIRKALITARHLYSLRQDRWNCSTIIFAVYIILLVFFLIGYIAIGIMLYCPAYVVSNFLVGMIFFFGSIFVLIGLFVQSSLGMAINKANLEIIHVLISAVEARDKNLNGHSLHVAALSMLLYDRIPKAWQKSLNRTSLEYAALLHDIGKLGIPEAILNKDGPLDEKEWAEIRRHPQIGWDILHSVDGFAALANWVKYHHERCDGKGYYGLPEEEIPLASRIIAVADTFSALTMTRSYRDSRTYEQAIGILRECAGTQLDSGIVELFLMIPQEAACFQEETFGKLFSQGNPASMTGSPRCP